ncbi:cytochrome P450 [Irpex lacteus]|nr:cytochrome P450 [Irpex lacteus]
MASSYLNYVPWLLCAVPIVYAIASRPKGKLPPGPKPLPVLGNILDVPADAAWKVFQQWGKKYGDVIYLETLGKKMVVLNSAAAAFELLDKRSAIYSYRPNFTMANEKFSLTSMDYSEKSKKQRKYLQSYSRRAACRTTMAFKLKKCITIYVDVVWSRWRFLAATIRMAAGITMMIAYGHKVESEDDEFLAIADKGVATIEAAGAIGAHIVDFVPWLRYIPDWFPGASIKSVPPGTRENLQTFINVPFERVKQRMVEGTATPCYVTKIFEETRGQDDEGVRGTAALVYSGGLDTSHGIDAIFDDDRFTMIVAHPIVQARIQAEMDLVIGRQYNGYLIPADSTIMANQWAMLHDERVYPDPSSFNPDRFLKGEGHTPQNDPRDVAFGFGRRQDLAENSLWITITPAVDDQGAPIPIDLEYREHGVRHPKPFKCDIVPRNETSVDLIRAELEA